MPTTGVHGSWQTGHLHGREAVFVLDSIERVVPNYPANGGVQSEEKERSCHEDEHKTHCVLCLGLGEVSLVQ